MTDIGTGITTDVAVIGGGVVGAALAYELAAAGAGVVLLDGDKPGRASAAGAGIASPQTFAEADEDWYRFGASALEHLRKLVGRLGEDGVELGPSAFGECGSLVIALAEHEDPWFQEVAGLALGRDSEVAEVPPSQAQGLFPPLARPWRALHSPRSCRVDGRLLTEALRIAATRRGVTLVSHEVTGVALSSAGGATVTAGDVVVSCATVAIAAGAWSKALAGQLGIVLPVFPTKGEIVHMGTSADGAQWPIVQPVLNFYLVPWPDGRVACGGTFEPGAGFDLRPTAKGARDLLREALTIAPGLAEATLLEARVGLRPASPDERPMLGSMASRPDVHVCTGHGANGLLLGPYSAALVASGILSGSPPDELPPFDPARFTAS
ncbi:MAG TPA: FAD-dependent oxidoreductase [Acidimicrobiales bacterium]|nr:FAD-dependent oxidoreductase [Acidimicrobiales bacterium]